MGEDMKIEPVEMMVMFRSGFEYVIVRCLPLVGERDEWVDRDPIRGYWWKIWVGGQTMNAHGEWEHEPLPSERSEEYLHANRHKYDDAVELIKRWHDRDE